MIEKKISERYARALFSIAEEIKQIEGTYDDLLQIRSVVESSREMQVMLVNPVIKYDMKINIFKEIFSGKVSKLTYDFLVLIIKKQREMMIISIIAQFEILFNIKNNRMPTLVTTAIELDEKTKSFITNKISEITQKESITSFEIDPSIKAGVKVLIDDWVYDAGLETKLDRIHHALIHGSA